MSESEQEVYKAPAAELDTATGNKKAAESLTRFTTWGVVGLSIITLGIYAVFWFINRSREINTVHDKGIIMFIPYILGLLIFLYWCGMAAVIVFSSNPNADPQTVALVTSIANFSNIIYLVLSYYLVFAIRNRVKDLFDTDINIILTLFLTYFYLQYKINQAIDNSKA